MQFVKTAIDIGWPPNELREPEHSYRAKDPQHRISWFYIMINVVSTNVGLSYIAKV